MRVERVISHAGSLILLVLIVLLTGCVKPAMHRPQNIEPHEGHTLAFIEFDDQGEPWAPSQLERTIDLIDRANDKGRAIVVLFVHGWQNDASKREDRKKDNNVEGFSRFLDIVHEQMEREGKLAPTDSLIGVYIGWRGRSSNNKLVKPMTFYSRRGAGQRVAGLDTTEAIVRVMAAAKKNPRSAGVVIGHSFGGMIVERALTQALVGATVSEEEAIDPLADLVILVNPASQSMIAKSMVSILERNRLKFYREDAEGNRRESPLVVSVTSTGDTATGNLYPMALGLKGTSKKFREYELTDCSPLGSQKPFYKQTAGHNMVLHSHVVTAEPLSERERETGLDSFELEESINPETGAVRHSFRGSEYRFNIDELSLAYNDTPYWIMSVPPELIRSHSDIFNLNALQLMRAVIRLGGVTRGDEKALLARETGIRPLAVGLLPDDRVAFLDRSRRFYVVGEKGHRPLALSCLPPMINPESVIGGYHKGSRLIMITNGQEADAKKPKLRTDVFSFDFTLTGSESVELVELKSEERFTAAAGHAEKKRIYLVGPGALYQAELGQKKKPVPELLSRFEKPETINWLIEDEEGQRLFALDREEGALYIFDLSSATPTPELSATGLGVPTDLFYREDGSLLIVDAPGKRILKLDCSQGRGCSQPKVFASPPELEYPVTIAVDSEGTTWVGDLEAQSIFALDSGGKVVRVIDSIMGAAR